MEKLILDHIASDKGISNEFVAKQLDKASYLWCAKKFLTRVWGTTNMGSRPAMIIINQVLVAKHPLLWIKFLFGGL